MFPQRDPLWKHFNFTLSATGTIQCVHCRKQVQPTPEEMKVHLAECQSIVCLPKDSQGGDGIQFSMLGDDGNQVSKVCDDGNQVSMICDDGNQCSSQTDFQHPSPDQTNFQHPSPDQTKYQHPPPILSMGIVGDGSNHDYLQMHIGCAEAFGRIQLVSGCLTFVNSQRNHFAHLYSIPFHRSYSSYLDFCQKESKKQLNMVVIASTLNSHYTMAMEAIERGFHIMCESPLCMTENEAVTLCKAAQVKGCVFHVMNPFCFFPMVIMMREIVNNYLLGEVTHIHIQYLQNHRMNDDESSDPMEMGVSDCTARLGIPAYEVLRFIYPKPVYRLMACLASVSSSDLFDDHSYITVELEGGVMASLVLSKLSILHEDELTIQIEGMLASIEWSSSHSDKLHVCYADGTEEIIDKSTQQFHGILVPPCLGVSQPLCSMYKTFYQHVCSVLKGQPFCPSCITVKEAMESIFFLSMCVASNLHMNSWVELRIPDF